MQNNSLKTQVHVGIRWTTVSIIFERTTRFITTIVLARLLAPEMFGQIAIANLCIELLGTLRRIGFGAAYIQRKDNPDESSGLAANTMFWTNGFINVLLFVVASLLTPLIAQFFRSMELEQILRVMFLTFIVDALSMVPAMDLQKRLEFKKLNMNIVYPYLAMLAAFGYLMDYGLRWLQRWWCPWFERHQG